MPLVNILSAITPVAIDAANDKPLPTGPGRETFFKRLEVALKAGAKTAKPPAVGTNSLANFSEITPSPLR